MIVEAKKTCTECKRTKAICAFDVSETTGEPYPRCRKCRGLKHGHKMKLTKQINLAPVDFMVQVTNVVVQSGFRDLEEAVRTVLRDVVMGRIKYANGVLHQGTANG